MADNNNIKNSSDERAKLVFDEQHRLKILQERSEKFNRKKIYIISGDIGIRETIKSMLECLGFLHKNITVTNNSSKLLKELFQNIKSVDLIFCGIHALDIGYSEQTGIQLLNHVKSIVRKSSIEKDIHFIVMEKSFNPSDVKNAFQAGAAQFIVFPTSPLSLGEKLLEVFEKEEESPLNKEIQQLVLTGNKFQERGLFDDAIYCYNKALEIGGEDIDILNKKANTLIEMHKIEDAISIYKHIIQVEENFPRAYQGLETAYSQLGDISEAKKCCKKVLEYEPDNVQVHYDLGLLYMDEGNYSIAEKTFQAGIKINGMFVKNFLGLAKNFDLQGNIQEALRVYMQAIKRNPKQTFLYVTAGDFCLKNELFADADRIFNDSINLGESTSHLYNRRGIALRKQGKFEEAIQNYEKALSYDPHDSTLYYNLAKSYYLAGNEKMSLVKLQKAFDINPVLDFKLKIEEDKNFSKLLENNKNKLNFSGLKKENSG
ncbi:MAG: tetratricopeptide repeat protein [Nitrospinae bacterium]|nr:tetratricopeptide repeat protein [Nitrospinota bacterium]